MSLNLDGIFAPVTTPFARGGEVDAAGFAANIRAHLAAGLDGIVVAGSTGEAALLDERERALLIETARSVIPDDRRLIVGTGAESTRTCLALTRRAAELGAEAVLVVAPHYYGAAMTTAALIAHYRAVADASPVPVILYTIPKYMHFALSAEVVADLATHENIIGIKDSSGKAELLAGYLESASDDFAVLVGSGALFQHALEAGARGGILGVSLFAPALSREIYALVRRGESALAAKRHEQLAPLHTRVVGELGVAGVKAALDAVGLIGGAPRPPLGPLSAELAGQLRAMLKGVELAAA